MAGRAGLGGLGGKGGVAQGGAIFTAQSGVTTLINSSVYLNEVSGGSGGDGGFAGNDGFPSRGGSGGSGGNGQGGAVYNHLSDTMIVNSSVFANLTAGGFGGGAGMGTLGSLWGQLGDGGDGMGAIYNQSVQLGLPPQITGNLVLTNSTVSSNLTLGGPGGSGSANAGTGSAGGDGFGGGVFSDTGLIVQYSTIAFNQALGNAGSPGGTSGSGFGGGVSGILPLVNVGTFFNTIIANNTGAAQCYGNMVSNNYNLSSDSSCDLTGGNDFPGGNAGLLSPAYNGGVTLPDGGVTPTIELAVDSDALDAGSCSPEIVTDQRGIPRPQGAGCDIGAYELIQIPNNLPVANDDNYVIDEDTVLNISAPGVLANDTGGGVTANLIDGTDFGVLIFNSDGSFSYEPMTDFFGFDGFTYQITDGLTLSNLATVTIEVLAVDDPPPAPICEPDPEADLAGWIEADAMTGMVTNNSEACDYIVGMASYNMSDDIIDHQTLFGSMHPVSVPPGETIALSVQVPPCARQIDLFYGDLLLNLSGVRYGERLLDAVQIDAGDWCGQTAAP
jgi:hypothetical protein